MVDEAAGGGPTDASLNWRRMLGEHHEDRKQFDAAAAVYRDLVNQLHHPAASSAASWQFHGAPYISIGWSYLGMAYKRGGRAQQALNAFKAGALHIQGRISGLTREQQASSPGLRESLLYHKAELLDGAIAACEIDLLTLAETMQAVEKELVQTVTVLAASLSIDLTPCIEFHRVSRQQGSGIVALYPWIFGGPPNIAYQYDVRGSKWHQAFHRMTPDAHGRLEIRCGGPKEGFAAPKDVVKTLHTGGPLVAAGKQCNACNASASGLKLCGGCKAVWYCSIGQVP